MGWYHVADGQKISAAHYNLAIDQGVLAFANAAERDAALTTATKHLGMTCYLQDVKKILCWDGTTWVDVVAPTGGNFLPLTGGTLTGALNIEYNGAALNLKATTNSVPRVYGYKDALRRWAVIPGNSTAETGSNAGSNFDIQPTADDGTTNLPVALRITRSTSLITVAGDPTVALGVATKQYVDGKMPTATAVLKVGAAASAPAAGGLADGSVYFGHA